MRRNYVFTPWSIYQGIKKLPPAHFVVIRDAGQQISEPYCYWNLSEIAEQASATQAESNSEDLTNELDRLLRDAVYSRMAADVPLGTFLSGGFDSTPAYYLG